MVMHTKDKLAEALRAVGLADMADKAATGYYHDFLSPLDFPDIQLVNDLQEVIKTKSGEDRQTIVELRDRVMEGDFDASREESDEWADSPEGQETMSWLKTKSSRS